MARTATLALVALLVLAGVAASQSDCVATTLKDFYFDMTDATAPFQYYYNITNDFSISYVMCSQVNLMAGNYSDVHKRDGYNFGQYQSTLLITPAPGKPTFRQTFREGDLGYPCPMGRSADVFLWCNNTADMGGYVCPGPVGSNGCVYSAFYDRDDTCHLRIDVSMSDCPKPRHIPIPIYNPGWTGAQIFFFIVFMLLLVGFIGGFAWNYKVKGQRGWDAVPGWKVLGNIMGKIRAPVAGSASGYNNAGYAFGRSDDLQAQQQQRNDAPVSYQQGTA